jgi:hypothetical protein
MNILCDVFNKHKLKTTKVYNYGSAPVEKTVCERCGKVIEIKVFSTEDEPYIAEMYLDEEDKIQVALKIIREFLYDEEELVNARIKDVKNHKINLWDKRILTTQYGYTKEYLSYLIKKVRNKIK